MFTGSIVALVTPFCAQGVDVGALANLVRFHIENGTDGIVGVGTTGEAPTLSPQEHQRVVEIVVAEVAGQVPVIAGAGSNSTSKAIEYHRQANRSGADGALHAMGYYNRPNPEGVVQHFRAIDQSAELPIIVYNVPPCAIIDFEPPTMARLATFEHVVGVKDATRDLSRPLAEKRLIKTPFTYLSGEDPTAVAYNAQCGNGCISVTANVAPVYSRELQDACLQGDYRTALDIQLSLMPLHDALFTEPSPAGVKYACSLLGLCEASCRLPIVELTEKTKVSIRSAMEGLELI